MSEAVVANPTSAISLDFGQYLKQRRRALEGHVSACGITDYAYGLDHVLRQKIAAVALARQIVRTVAASVGPLQSHLHNMQMVALGEDQFPHIHDLGKKCARILGIGIPQMFIMPSPFLSAYTFGTDDICPVIVLSSGLVEALSIDELLFVVGHECGHVHNLHGAYNMAIQNVTNPLAKLMLENVASLGIALDVIKTLGHLKLLATAIAGALKLFFLNWSRAAEVTCDRAGLICCGDVAVAQSALGRLATGGVASLRDLNVAEYVAQLEVTKSSPVRLFELGYTHPLLPKRIAALKYFSDCDVYRKWRPDAAKAGKLLGRSEVDDKCTDLLGVVRGRRQSKD